MTNANLAKMLPGPLCLEARAWLETQPDARTAWETCRRGDWLLYQLGHARGIDRKRLVSVACKCARLALRYVPTGEHRPRLAIEAAEAWCRGAATREQLWQARSDAYATASAAASAAAYAAAARAAYAAAYAAYADAASAAAYAPAAAAAAAVDAADAADAAAANLDEAEASRRSVLAETADIVREHFTLTDLMG